MNSKWQSYFMDVALRTARLSHAIRLKVGAVAVLDNRIICVGFNGTPPGEDNSCEIMINNELVTKANVIHAEANLIKFAKTHNIAIAGTDIYITHSPCQGCADAIISAGFSRVYYNTLYRNSEGLTRLAAHNIHHFQVD